MKSTGSLQIRFHYLKILCKIVKSINQASNFHLLQIYSTDKKAGVPVVQKGNEVTCCRRC